MIVINCRQILSEKLQHIIQPLNAHHGCTQGLVLHPEDVPVFPTISTFCGYQASCHRGLWLLTMTLKGARLYQTSFVLHNCSENRIHPLEEWLYHLSKKNNLNAEEILCKLSLLSALFCFHNKIIWYTLEFCLVQF